MSWKDTLTRVTLPDGRRLIGASFRGVPFLVSAGERSGGRRIVSHEFKNRDPYHEDNGKRTIPHRLDGYVLGDDYISQKDALIVALEAEAGPGELVHPYYGVRRAVCPGFSVRESVAEGGMAVFAIEFIEAASTTPAPAVSVDRVSEVEARAAEAAAATTADFDASFDVDGQPSWAVASLAAEFSGVLTAAKDHLSKVVTDTQELARLTAEIEVLTQQATTLVRQPDQVVTKLSERIADLVEASETAPRAVIGALLAAYATPEAALAPATTATRVKEAANHAELSAALRRVLAIEAARLLPRVTFATFEEAIAERDEVMAAIDEQAATAGDAAYPALIALRAAAASAVPGDAELATEYTVERPVAIPSLLLSYQLYGSVAQESDILARNGVAHPGFVMGALKVLTDG